MDRQQHPQPALNPGDVFPAPGVPVAHAEREHLLDRSSDEASADRLSVKETDLPGGKCLVTASAKGQVLSQFTVPAPADASELSGEDAVSIGEALEAAAAATTDRPVSRSDAAAVQAAETRATRLGRAVAGGVGAAAQKAAETNARAECAKEDKVRISDVLADAADRLAEDKVATREDAERVRAAEERNAEGAAEGGIADAVEAASRINRGVA